ncbi:glycerophosphoryl diester phosphodiesterase [Opitutaceae bacterium TAV1]|nr:glycerophosphoryl diester phosphodiesterase [Opitutaceae bacterium TAV1]
MKTGFLQNGVTAHRGDCEKFPENSLESIRAAIETGADWVEVDVRATRDGALVLCHDETTGRTGDRDLRISETTLADLLAVNLGRHGVNIRMPTLVESLALIRTQNRTRISLQPKADIVSAIVRAIRELGVEDRAGFNDGDLAKLKQAKALLPQAVIFRDCHTYAAGSDGDAALAHDISQTQAHGFEAIVLRKDTVTPKRAAMIRKAGLEPGAWTVNDESEMRMLFAAGVERIYTDFPRTALNAMMRKYSPADPLS